MYTLEVRDDLLAPPLFWARGAIDADDDDDVEIIATVYVDNPGENNQYLTVADRAGSQWIDTGARVPLGFSGIGATAVSDDGVKADRFAFLSGYYEDPRIHEFSAVSVVRVLPDLRLELEAVFHPNLQVFDLAVGDVSGDGQSDIIIPCAGNTDEGVAAFINVYFATQGDWSNPQSYDTYSLYAHAADMSGDGVAELFTMKPPTQVLNIPTGEKFELPDALWPLALHDVNGDGVHEVLYRPYSGDWRPTGSEESPLEILVSFD
jgi:hypothetical protein